MKCRGLFPSLTQGESGLVERRMHDPLLCLHSGDSQGTSLVPTRTLSHVHVEQRAFWVRFSPPNGYTFFCGYDLGLTPFLWLAWDLFSLLLFSAFQVLSSQSLGWPSKPWGQLWARLLLASEHLLPRTWTWLISSAAVAFFLIWFLPLNYWEDYCLITHLKVDPIAWPTLLGMSGSSYLVIFNAGREKGGLEICGRSLCHLNSWRKVLKGLLPGNGLNSLAVKRGLCHTEFWYSKLYPTPEPSHMMLLELEGSPATFCIALFWFPSQHVSVVISLFSYLLLDF